MCRIRFSDRQLADMVMGLIGEVEPVGETREDDKRFDNLLLLQDTVDILLDEIYYCCGYSDNVEYSMKRSAETAIAWMEKKRDWFNEIFGTEDEQE